MWATVIVIVWTIAATGALGVNGDVNSLLQALAAYRCLSGVGIGAEYPGASCRSSKKFPLSDKISVRAAGSVAASENTEDPSIKKGTQQSVALVLSFRTTLINFVACFSFSQRIA